MKKDIYREEIMEMIGKIEDESFFKKYIHIA